MYLVDLRKVCCVLTKFTPTISRDYQLDQKGLTGKRSEYRLRVGSSRRYALWVLRRPQRDFSRSSTEQARENTGAKCFRNTPRVHAIERNARNRGTERRTKIKFALKRRSNLIAGWTGPQNLVFFLTIGLSNCSFEQMRVTGVHFPRLNYVVPWVCFAAQHTSAISRVTAMSYVFLYAWVYYF